MSTSCRSNILLTGHPGIGKTTVIMRLAERLVDRTLAGFYTEELRLGAQRQGFRAVAGNCINTAERCRGQSGYQSCQSLRGPARHVVTVHDMQRVVVLVHMQAGEIAPCATYGVKGAALHCIENNSITQVFVDYRAGLLDGPGGFIDQA